MVRHSVQRWIVAAAALAWACPVSAGPIVSSNTSPESMTGTAVSPLFVTGNVEKDLPARSESVTVVPGRSIDSVAQPKWMTDAGLINGYVMKDIRLSYDQKSDTLAVGVNYYGIAGNTDGSRDGSTSPQTIAMGGSNPPHLGGDKSITVAFTPVTEKGINAAPLVVAGVPAIKSVAPAGTTDHFDVATFQNSPGGLGRSYGPTLTANLGNLAYDPSQAHPGFEFTIKNFSKIPGLNALTKGFYIQAYTGTGTTTIVGKSMIYNTFVGTPLKGPQKIVGPTDITPPTPGTTVPEPATILAWGLVAGGSAWRVRRRFRPQARP